MAWSPSTAPSGRCVRLIETPLGLLRAEATGGRVVFLTFRQHRAAGAGTGGEDARVLGHLAREVEAYFGGSLSSFSVPFEARGTQFRQRVWRGLLEIPYGRVETYGAVAARIGRPGAARAVGQACRANPLPLLVPCHRVVARGGLGGYCGTGAEGLRRKRRLLRLEGALQG